MGDLLTDGLGVDCSYSERIWYNKSIDIVHYFKNRQLRLPQNITTKKLMINLIFALRRFDSFYPRCTSSHC